MFADNQRARWSCYGKLFLEVLFLFFADQSLPFFDGPKLSCLSLKAKWFYQLRNKLVDCELVRLVGADSALFSPKGGTQVANKLDNSRRLSAQCGVCRDCCVFYLWN